MKKVFLFLLLVPSFTQADYIITAKGGVDGGAGYMGGGEITYYGFLDYLEAGVFGEGHSGGKAVGGIVTRLYLPILGLFIDAKLGNCAGIGAGIRVSLPIEVRPFVSVMMTSRDAYATGGVMLSIKL